MQSEISLCRVYKRSGIDDGHGHSSSRTQAASGRRTHSRTARHVSSSSPSSSTQLSPIQHPAAGSFHLLQGECSSTPPTAIIMDHVITAHNNVSQLLPPPRPPRANFAPSSVSSLAAAVAPAEEGATILASTYSLLNMAAVPMGSSRPVDELSTLVGHSPFSANHLSGATNSHFLPLPSLQPPMAQVLPLGGLPMASPLASSVADKLSWDWNPIPDTMARDDYSTSSFK